MLPLLNGSWKFVVDESVQCIGCAAPHPQHMSETGLKKIRQDENIIAIAIVEG